MKGFVGLAVFGVLVVVGFIYFSNSMQEGQGVTFAYAVGNPNGDEQEIHVVIQPLTITRNPPKVDPVSGNTLWDDWLKDHFELLANDGARVDFIRRSNSSLISDQKARGAPEFYLVGTVKTGETYMFDHITGDDMSERYRDKFTVPSDGLPFKRTNFESVE